MAYIICELNYLVRNAIKIQIAVNKTFTFSQNNQILKIKSLDSIFKLIEFSKCPPKL